MPDIFANTGYVSYENLQADPPNLHTANPGVTETAFSGYTADYFSGS